MHHPGTFQATRNRGASPGICHEGQKGWNEDASARVGSGGFAERSFEELSWIDDDT
jgi:hypothetical protein